MTGCWQTNANQSQFARNRRNLGGTDLPPFLESGGSLELENVPAGGAAFLIEVGVDGRMDGGEELQTSHPAEPEHRALPSSQWLVRVLDAIVQTAPCRVQICPTELTQCRAVRWEPIGDDLMRPAVTPHQFPEEFQCRLLVPSLGGDGFENFSFVIDGPPEIMPLTVDFHEHLVDVPPPVREGAQSVDAPAPDLGGEHWPKPMPPEPDRLVADVDAAFVQQVLDIPKRERKPDVHHHGQADDLWAGFEIPEGAALAHAARVGRWLSPLNLVCSDSAQ